jgi:hypothetical protein
MNVVQAAGLRTLLLDSEHPLLAFHFQTRGPFSDLCPGLTAETVQALSELLGQLPDVGPLRSREVPAPARPPRTEEPAPTRTRTGSCDRVALTH